MALLVVLRKMLKNRWLTLCLLLGLMIAIATGQQHPDLQQWCACSVF
jgi:hypothetical protein